MSSTALVSHETYLTSFGAVDLLRDILPEAPAKVICTFLGEWEKQKNTVLAVKDVRAAIRLYVSLMMRAIMGFSLSQGGNQQLLPPRDLLVPWDDVRSQFPWACYISEGAEKNVFKVCNAASGGHEALSFYRKSLEEMEDTSVVYTELAIAFILSTYCRIYSFPHFVLVNGAFTSNHSAPMDGWGDQHSLPPEPIADEEGCFLYTHMELCKYGSLEEYIKKQQNAQLPVELAAYLLFQIAVALQVARCEFSMKHYDVKLLNVFVQDCSECSFPLRYKVDGKEFVVPTVPGHEVLAKLGDFGTSNMEAASDGQPVSTAQITTVENTPPEYMFQGDKATQGHGHDHFGLGLSMLHLFTGDAPYEEILVEVRCPQVLKDNLCKVWKNGGFKVLLKDGREPHVELYDALYRYLVLLASPADIESKRNEIESKPNNDGDKVWTAIVDSLRQGRRSGGLQFANDCAKYSLSGGTNASIARGRTRLQVSRTRNVFLIS